VLLRDVFSCVYTTTFFDHWRNASSSLARLVATWQSSEENTSRDRSGKRDGNIAVDCVRALVLLWYIGSPGMSKRLASIVRRSPCYPFHGSPRDSFVRENPLPTKFNIRRRNTLWNSTRRVHQRNPRICVRLIGGIPDIAEKILSQLRHAACSRCSSMNLPTESVALGRTDWEDANCVCYFEQGTTHYHYSSIISSILVFFNIWTFFSDRCLILCLSFSKQTTFVCF